MVSGEGQDVRWRRAPSLVCCPAVKLGSSVKPSTQISPRLDVAQANLGSSPHTEAARLATFPTSRVGVRWTYNQQPPIEPRLTRLPPVFFMDFHSAQIPSEPADSADSWPASLLSCCPAPRIRLCA